MDAGDTAGSAQGEAGCCAACMGCIEEADWRAGLGMDMRQSASSTPARHLPACAVQVLTVVDVSLTSASPCLRIFPAVLALAKNFQVGGWVDERVGGWAGGQGSTRLTGWWGINCAGCKPLQLASQAFLPRC